MENINAILLVAQVVLSISLITLVLLQHGKGADAGAAFGSGASATVFGAKGSGNFLTRATSVVAMLFFVTCLSLAYLASHREGPSSVVDSVVDTQSIDSGKVTSSTLEQGNKVLTQPENSDLPPMESVAEPEGSTSSSDLPPVE